MTKESKRLQLKMSQGAQEAYYKIGMARFREEASHVVTEAEALAMEKRWTKIADLLDDGWILDFEAVDILKGMG